jgi:enoyl-CoA hydratase
MNQFIEVQHYDKHTLLTLNRPEVLNAINNDMRKEIVFVLGELVEKDDCRALIITGKGKSFCVGADVKELGQLNQIQYRKKANFGANEPYNSISHFPKPTIAAINGYALGGGCEMALACDIRICSSDASFGLPEVTRGLIPGSGGTQRLPRLIGSGLAKELIFTGKRISAQEAERIGLVNHVYSPEELMTKATELAQIIADNAPLGVFLSKAAIDRGLEMDLSSGLSYESELGTIILGTEDRLEGSKAAQEKRKPIFMNK